MRRMGLLAMENLIKLMSGQESVVRIKVKAELIVRESTGKVKRTKPGGTGIHSRTDAFQTRPAANNVRFHSNPRIDWRW